MKTINPRWKGSTNTLENSLFECCIGTLALGGIGALAIANWTTSISYALVMVTNVVCVGFSTLAILSSFNLNRAMAWLISISCFAMVNTYEYAWYPNAQEAKQVEGKYAVAGGLLSDSYYAYVPEMIQVNSEATKVEKPYVIRASTNDGWMTKTFLCHSPELTKSCGKEL